MCGIAGVFDFQGRPVDASLLRRMIGRVGYRGPDDSGVHTGGPAGIANVRLSIIDVAGGQQPMASRDGTLWITFNGEIFNYVELRAELQARGHVFATRSDTEVILKAYEEKGEACVQDFNGQWAFAIWDARRRRLFLSRDRLGVRPLFYAHTGSSLVFGSEIKSLLAHPAVPRELDLRGLDEVFTFWCALAPRTVFRGVEELPAGHSMVVNESGDARIAPHWRLDYPAAPDGQRNPDEAAEELRALLVDATRIRLRSDVPVGAYLSGGLDSTVHRPPSSSGSRTRGCGRSRSRSTTRSSTRAAISSEAVRFLQSEHHEVRCSGADIATVFPDVDLARGDADASHGARAAVPALAAGARAAATR